MGILSALFGPSRLAAAGETDLADPRSWRLAGGAFTNAGARVNETTAQALPAVTSAIGLIADQVGQLPLHVYEEMKSGRRELVTEHPTAEVLKLRPNDRTTSFVFRKLIQTHVLGWGNGYAEIERNGRDQAVGLWQLLPSMTRPEVQRGGGVRILTRVDGREVALAWQNCLHVKAGSVDGIVGVSPLAQHREAIGLAKATEEFGARWFGNGSKSGVVLKLPKTITPEAERRLKEAWSQDNEGLENAHRVRILYEGADVAATSIPPEDAQFLQTREFQIAEIARIYRVPLHMLQAQQKSTSWGSGIEQMKLGFLQYTLQPWLLSWEQECDSKLFVGSERGRFFVKFALEALLRGDSTSRAAFYSSGVTTGWLMRNEVRELEDLEPIDGLDELPLPNTPAPPPSSPRGPQDPTDQPDQPEVDDPTGVDDQPAEEQTR